MCVCVNTLLSTPQLDAEWRGKDCPTFPSLRLSVHPLTMLLLFEESLPQWMDDGVVWCLENYFNFIYMLIRCGNRCCSNYSFASLCQERTNEKRTETKNWMEKINKDKFVLCYCNLSSSPSQFPYPFWNWKQIDWLCMNILSLSLSPSPSSALSNTSHSFINHQILIIYPLWQCYQFKLKTLSFCLPLFSERWYA